MPETRKTNTFIEKTIRVSETLKNSYERGHSTASETKNNNFIEKTILISKTLYSLDKKTQHRRAKCPRPTKPALSLKRQFYFLKRKDLAKNYKKQFLNISPLDFWKKKQTAHRNRAYSTWAMEASTSLLRRLRCQKPTQRCRETCIRQKCLG